jgi:hypothetical protein
MRFAPFAVIIPITNLQLDPDTGMRKGEVERLAVEQILAGHDVLYVGNDRRFQRDYFERATAGPDVLVLGSSRSMRVATRHVGGRRLWNGSVTSAGLEELVMTYLLAARSRAAPRTVLLSLDLRHFQQLEPGRWSGAWSVAEIERAGLAVGVPLFAPHADLLRLRAATVTLSPAEFQRAFIQASVRAIRFHPSARLSDVLPAPGDAVRRIIRRTDGSLYFPPRPFRARTVERPMGRPGSRSDGQLMAAGEGFRLLEGLIARIRGDGRTVGVLLPPYAPAFVTRPGAGALLAEVEGEVHRRAEAHDVAVLGSFDPAKCRCWWAEFYDETHPKDVCFDHFLPETLRR